MSNIVLNALTYVGDGIVNGVAWFTERSAGTAAYFRSLTSSVSAKKGQRISVKWKLVKPFPAAAAESCPCPGEAPYTDTIVDITVRFDPRADAAYRTAVTTDIQNLAATTQFTGSINSLIQPT